VQISVVDDDGGVRRSARETEGGTRWQNVLGDNGTIPRNGAGVDDKHDSLCVIEVVLILDPDAWMAGYIHGLDRLFIW